MSDVKPYPIGTPGKPWGEEEKTQWLAKQSVQRSYQDEVLARIEGLKDRFDVVQYGALSHSPDRYPLFIVKTKGWSNTKKNVLITGGVHGYETSGVQGAIRFLETAAEQYAEHFNIMVAPCVSPWGYETINRWNPNAIDPNRSFYEDSPSEEAALLMRYVFELQIDIFFQMDLHETTDTDSVEFGPALMARDAQFYEGWDKIPDGFYLVADEKNPQPELQKAIIDAVKKVTHIAPPDENGNIIDLPVIQEGLVSCAFEGICTTFSQAAYNSTTEVYPDSPKVTDENCIEAQVAAVKAGLDYLVADCS